MYYVLLDSFATRTRVIKELHQQGINTVFHYVPLHLSPAGKQYARVHGELTHTEDLSDRLLRLPLWVGMDNVDRVVNALTQLL
jgi:dTDP-4-amino-4,6-dideoxygalactose transaminase